MDPITIGAFVDLGIKIEGIAVGIFQQLKAAGVTDEQILQYRQDYADRIAKREQDADQG